MDAADRVALDTIHAQLVKMHQAPPDSQAPPPHAHLLAMWRGGHTVITGV